MSLLARIEGDDLVYAVLPSVVATPAQHKESLQSAGVKVKKVEPSEGRVIEIRIDKRGVMKRTVEAEEEFDREKMRNLERTIRGRCGQILMN
ncbi:MAG: hypothetical protein PHE68_00335 [Candidatus Peribacteraceae bacterium]|nr:hypothetical protein [Candidatus Peribacteraceae bacterium]MDD5074444.1 hypothetical protein [Candidatus Peribacteraceae bacterium]